MFRTVTVHHQELLSRCCMCRLWYVVRNALPDTSSWYNVLGRHLSTNKHLISATTLCISLECIYIAKKWYTDLPMSGTGIISLTLERHVDHTSPSSVEVKNEWSFLYSPSYAFVACTGITWPLLVIYIYLYACVCRYLCVCIQERMAVQMVKLLVCVREIPLSNLGQDTV